MRILRLYLSLAVMLGWVGVRPLAAADQRSGAPAPPSKVENVTVEQTAKLVADQKVTVLDIRTPEEFKAGHIAGAVNLNFNDPDFAKKLGELDKTKPYVVHSAAGGRSAKSLDQFKKLQFVSIYHFKGGFKAWEKAGQPVAK